VLGRILQQQRADVLAVGAVTVLVVGAVAGSTDKAAVLPQPDLCIKTVGSIALHQRRDMAYAILVGGATALQDAAAVFLGTLKYHFAQQCADLVCVHGCPLPRFAGENLLIL
jgi:NhaP-type Na+/H+ and K+/H+ antiporter